MLIEPSPEQFTEWLQNDLSHLSDEEFNSLAPQGYHATGPIEPLSPAAQAVLDALPGAPHLQMVNRAYAAAALRAAADQVVPKPLMIVEGGRTYEEAWTATVHDDIRRRFLAIAAELEGRHE